MKAATVQASLKAGESDEGLVEEIEEQISKITYAGYYFLLFIVHWGGSARFSKAKHPDDDFEPDNVHKFLKNQKGHEDDGHFLHGNFRRVDHHKLKQYEAKKKSREEAKAADSVKIMPQLQGREEEGDEGGMLDAIASPVAAGAEAQEDEAMENLFIKFIPPYFILAECFVIFALWIVGAALNNGSGSAGIITSKKGGLDTLAEPLYGMTDLRWSSSDCDDLRHQVWRWLTYQFTHVGISHVGMNLLLNIIMGIPLEGAHGCWRVGLMFNAGVFGGALSYFVLDGHAAVVGCSGGCYALIGIHFADLIMNWDSKKFRFPTLFMLVFLVGVDILNVFLNHAKGTSHAAHFGGAAFGLIAGVILCKNLVVESYERIIEVVTGVIGAGLLIAALVWIGIQDEGPRNIGQAQAGWCSAFAYRDVPAGSLTPTIHCSFCGTQECLAALRYQFKDCCPVGAVKCQSKPYWCVSPMPVTEEYCKKHDARWVDVSLAD